MTADLPLPEDAINAAVEFMHIRFPKWEPGDKGVGFPWPVFLDALAAAAPVLRAQGAAAERERIRQLAERCKATYLVPCDDPAHDGKLHTHHRDPFADLLAGDAP